MGNRKCLFVACALLAISLFWTVASAQTETAKAADTLTGDRVLARYSETSGGTEAFAKLTSQHTHGTVELMANLVMTVETFQQRPNKMKAVMTGDQVGTIERGYDGNLFWEKTTMNGTRLLESRELADAVRETAIFDKVSTWNDYFDKAELIGSDSVGSSICFKVLVHPKDGAEQTWYFDKNNGLLVKKIMAMETQMGSVPTEMIYSDYRQVGTVKLPFKNSTTIAGMATTILFDSIEHNIAIPDSVFAPPADAVKLAQPKKQ